MADGGTLFLDEVAEIPPTTQVKLLRALQEKSLERVGGTETVKTDIRVISATNKVLSQEIKTGTFREDLFYRLNVMPINLTPLRERPEDIPLLAQTFLERYAEKNHKRIAAISSAAMEILLRHNWPGNVREMENTMERAVILCRADKIEIEDLLSFNEDQKSTLLNEAVQKELKEEELTKMYARLILKQYGGNKKQACEVLGINFRTLQSRLTD
jgi:two-component system response regulator HydG